LERAEFVKNLILWDLKLHNQDLILLLTSSFPFFPDPDFRFPSPSAEVRRVRGKDDEAERDHPESEDGQETENAAKD
tara:strand:- start:760 stop:990 length:231 start_codon:yes stop_codon:yes gene_type:complete